MLNKSLSVSFTREQLPHWVCPTCKMGMMKIVEGSFYSRSNKESTDAHKVDVWEPDYDLSIFSCLLECTSKFCGEVVACSGHGTLEQDFISEERGWGYQQYYQAKQFLPPMMVFEFPEDCPKAVCDPLVDAFSLFLNHPSAAANSIRISVEELLTHLQIPRTKGLVLDKRLKILAAPHPQPHPHASHADSLLAIKFLGNAGSHAYDQVETGDIVGAFVIMEYVLSDIYDKKAARVKKIADGMSEKFKPKP